MMRCRIFENGFCNGRVVRTRPAAHDPKNPWVNILQLHVFGRRVCVCGLATVENVERSNLSSSSRVKLPPLSKMTFGRDSFCKKKKMIMTAEYDRKKYPMCVILLEKKNIGGNCWLTKKNVCNRER